MVDEAVLEDDNRQDRSRRCVITVTSILVHHHTAHGKLAGVAFRLPGGGCVAPSATQDRGHLESWDVESSELLLLPASHCIRARLILSGTVILVHA